MQKLILILILVGVFVFGCSPSVSPTVEPTTVGEFEAFAMPMGQYPGYVIYPNSQLRTALPANATYVRENRIGTFRQGYQEWSMPIYRTAADANIPLVTVTNTYSGRTERWPIPTYALPAPEADAHLGVLSLATNLFYESWATEWTSSTAISAGGMVAYALTGNGITPNTNHRTTASGISMANGQITREDFIDPVTGELNVNTFAIYHALNISLPANILSKTYIAPAIGGEEAGSAGSNGIPMGAIFAIPSSVDVDALNVHPFTRLLLRAARDYGMYVTDGNGSPLYNGLSIATTRVEIGLVEELYGLDSNTFLFQVQEEIGAVIRQYGIYRVTLPNGTAVPPASITPAVNTATPTASPSFTPTRTPTRIPTATATRTPSIVPVSATPTVVNTASTAVSSVTRTPTLTPTPTPTITPSAVGTPSVTSTPIPAGFFIQIYTLNAVVPTNTNFYVQVLMVHVNRATGGGVRGIAFECTLSPESRLIGISTESGDFFPAGSIINNRSFPYTDWTYYRARAPRLITEDGLLLTMTIRAVSTGTLRIRCQSEVEMGNRVYRSIPIPTLTLTASN